MQNLVASGAGVAFAPDLGLTRLNPGVAVRPIAFGPKRRILAAYRAGERGSPGVPEMLDAVTETIATREPLFPARTALAARP
jgi:DNA-binding transcriptional LysR family regulator